MTGSPIFSINLINRKNPSNLNYHMSIKKSQAILKHFIDLSSLAFGLRCVQKTKPSSVTLRTFFRSTAGQDCQNTKWPAVYPARVLLAESLRSFLDKSGKGIEEREKRKEEKGKRKLKKVLGVTKHGYSVWLLKHLIRSYVYLAGSF